MVENKEDSVSIKNYKTLAEKKLPEELHKFLPTSFDIVGDIAIVKFCDEIKDYKKDIGASILSAYKSIKTVMNDSGVSGEWRQRTVEIVAGEDRTVTIHKEFNITLEVDLGKVFFSPRLATERWRVAQQVLSDECVVDAFAGVGPFSVMIAKHKKPKRIYSIDINPIAFQYLEKNIIINKVQNIVVPICGDSKTEMQSIGEKEKVTRIIMNLPWTSFEYIEPALKCISNGGKIHFYEINEADSIPSRIDGLNNKADSLDCKIKVLEKKILKSYSPSKINYVLDLEISN